MRMLSIILLQIFAVFSLSADQDYWKAEEYYQHSSSQQQAAADLMQYVDVRKDDSLLDVGCGDGKITAALAKMAPDGLVLGVDISPAMIGFAKQQFPESAYPNLQFGLKDAIALDFDEQFDTIFSFTALQWVQNHDSFLKGAYQGLKTSGTLAVTMPMGLPFTLEQAVTELIDTPEWAPYFQEFSTGWNFVDDVEYSALLSANQFTATRLAVVPQKDIFPSRTIFEKFIGQWFPYLRPLPDDLKQTFLTQVIDRFLELEPLFPNGDVHFKIRRLEVVAHKS